MTESPKELTIVIDYGNEADAETVDKTTTNLLREMQALDVETARKLRAEEAIPGTKAADAVTLGSIALAILPAYGAALIEFLRDWSLRRKDNQVTIKVKSGDKELEVSYNPDETTTDNMKYLIKEFAKLIED